MKKLEQYFQNFRRNIIGSQLTYNMNGEPRNIIYADWAASGRLYRPIEQYIHEELGPFVANTHTEATLTGTVMTHAYHQAGDIIKRHVNAGPDDVLLCAGFGMTAVINKFKHIIDLKTPEKLLKKKKNMPRQKPLVIITHMEHHSNQTTWEECLVDVAIVRRAE
ncbi:MAG: selenocysteine lyase, partial [Calditrichaeota bacterium]|nr:selenocysteine lyase [Calditrichota bacterium]